jgi:hypothetical protein
MVCDPADPLGISARYAVVAVVIAVQLDALIVKSASALKYAPAISTALPSAIADTALVVKLVKLTPQ